MTEKRTLTYKGAGVDIDRAQGFIEQLQPLARSTFRKEVMGSLGGFSGLFHLELNKAKDPVLVASTDGVGTKLKIAQMMNRHDTIGIDLVAMSVNDVIVQGAEPLFFLDYLASGRMDVPRAVQILEGIVKGCQEAGCALIGGETAEMPGFYRDEEYDLAGFCVGIVDMDKMIDGSAIRVGDRVIGLASTGLHSNGFSLVRRILLEEGKMKLDEGLEGLTGTLGEELLRPTRIYVKSLMNIVKNFTVKGVIHITGGGFIDNIPRIIPGPCRATITKNSWDVPAIFHAIRDRGQIDEAEMYRVFNMGIGMMLVVPEKESSEVMGRLENLRERAYQIGVIEKRHAGQPQVVFI